MAWAFAKYLTDPSIKSIETQAQAETDDAATRVLSGHRLDVSPVRARNCAREGDGRHIAVGLQQTTRSSGSAGLVIWREQFIQLTRKGANHFCDLDAVVEFQH